VHYTDMLCPLLFTVEYQMPSVSSAMTPVAPVCLQNQKNASGMQKVGSTSAQSCHCCHSWQAFAAPQAFPDLAYPAFVNYPLCIVHLPMQNPPANPLLNATCRGSKHN
jgi:hypothetical protein